jgi:hypothetical protein
VEHITAVLSMLHETRSRNSATRTFRDEPVLAWALERLAQSRHVGNIAILCWEDQLEHVTPIAEETSAYVLAKDPRVIVPAVECITAARNWSDGWRGGLLGTCDFDLGFYAPWIKEAADELNSDAIVLVDPSAGLVDPHLIDALVEHARERDNVQICFSQAAPGLAGVLLRPSLLEQLALSKLHPGRILSYLPDQPIRDPISGEGCLPVPASIARTTRSFKMNSDRQIARITEAAVDLNGELQSSDAQTLLHRFQWANQLDPLPREVVLELTTRRLSSPIYSPVRHHKFDRADLPMHIAQRLFDELGQADDSRLTLAGVGDPLLHPQLAQLVACAKRAGVHAIHVETDLLSSDANVIDQLVDPRIDVVSVHLPAMSPLLYYAIMGVDGFTRVLQNIQRFIARRHELGRGVPILVPTFIKCRENLAEMEAWYDQWIKALGCAVITGASDHAGQIPNFAVADMSPPMRKPCARLMSRLTILSDGRAVSCEQDVLGRQVVGNLNFDSLAIVWNNGMQPLRESHRCAKLDAHALCARCREWHRS